jgi:hypothetical protein
VPRSFDACGKSMTLNRKAQESSSRVRELERGEQQQQLVAVANDVENCFELVRSCGK